MTDSAVSASNSQPSRHDRRLRAAEIRRRLANLLLRREQPARHAPQDPGIWVDRTALSTTRSPGTARPGAVGRSAPLGILVERHFTGGASARETIRRVVQGRGDRCGVWARGVSRDVRVDAGGGRRGGGERRGGVCHVSGLVGQRCGVFEGES